ncbi:MAG: spore germination protein [Bacilli bacterium]|nr:spore germination protein [Bacilli bacterium]MDD4547367.1 spore germination protein [Bacilli bacterium]
MSKINKDLKVMVEEIKTKLGNPPDLIVKDLVVSGKKVSILSIESMSDSVIINDFILEYLSFDIKIEKNNNLLEYLYSNIPTNKCVKTEKIDEVIYNLLSGFTIVLVNGYELALSIETKAKINSDIAEAINERTTLGPNDAFTENYQINLGLIRKRLKTSELKISETVVGNKGKSKVAVMYLDDVADKDTAEIIFNRIKNIDIDVIFDPQQIVELISENEKNVFPNCVTTERPDYATSLLLGGRIAIVLENAPYISVVPANVDDFLQHIEDRYNRVISSSVNRTIRFLSIIITLLTPAIYVAMTTYNHESIPSKLLVSFSTQRSGVPFSTIMEALLMIMVFEILKETDARAPNSYSNSLTIVGALVLGEAAVTAGVVSPIMVIVSAITAISGLIVTYIDVVNGIRWWRLIFLIGAASSGFIGIMVVSFLFIANVTSIKSFGTPFMNGIAPMKKGNIWDSIFLSFENKFNRTLQKDMHKPSNKGSENK